MKKYIIIYEVKTEAKEDGKNRVMYHAGINTVDNNRGFINVYSENITRDRKKATVFYELNEAEKVKALFGDVYISAIVANKIR